MSRLTRPHTARWSVKGSAYDVYLMRALQYAQIDRSPTSSTVVDIFIEQSAEVDAGIKQQLEADAGCLGGLRLLNVRFMVIEQVMGTPKNRGKKPRPSLLDFFEEAKASGFVAAVLKCHRIEGASVALPTDNVRR